MQGPTKHQHPAGPGDLVWIRRRLWRVRHAHAGTGLTRLDVDSASGPGSRTFLLPADRICSDHQRSLREVSQGRALAWLAGCTARAVSAYTPSAVVAADVTLFAYQLEPALAVLAGSRRVLIADEVGLGKTVQASLIVAETTRRRGDARVLVLVPAPLVEQWSDELQARFGIPALIADAAGFARLRADRPYMNSPWQGPGVWIASPDYLKQPHVIEAMPDTPFDLVVVDEAHTMAGHSRRRAAINAIAAQARHVVLLTATPHDGDETRFGRLVSLGATGSRADGLTVFRRTRPADRRPMRRLAVAAGPGLSRALDAIDAFERAVSASRRAVLTLICAVFRKRALSSMAAFLASLDRRLSVIDGTHCAETDWEQLGLFAADLVPGDEWSALCGDTGLTPARERAWLQRLRYAASTGGDPKLTRLRALRERAREPVVVFTEYRDTLLAMAAALTGARDMAVLHGGLSSSRQGQALAAFLGRRADTLLTTDVACQGLNLQHRARWVIHFDLPWTPMRLEQRAGRVDRIGQTCQVHVTHLGIRHPADAALRARLAARRHTRDATRITSCARWTRVAEGLARTCGRQRALAARWRGPDPVALPRARVTYQLIRHLCGVDLPAITLVEIPILNGTGDVMERHLGWMPSAESPVPEGATPQTLVRRARALGARARLRVSREQAARAVRAPAAPQQRGLFEARDLPGSRDEEGAGRGAAGARAECADPTDVHAGAARALLIIEARR